MRRIIHYLRMAYKYGLIPIIYRVGYRKIKREFPKVVGVFLNVGNRIVDIIAFRTYKKIMNIETYDGSNQCVHPDVDVLPNKDYMALVCTPYPYNTEVYENPCLYIIPRLKVDRGGGGTFHREFTHQYIILLIEDTELTSENICLILR